MKNDDDAVLEEAADTTAKQLADGWLTWANTCTQQPPPSSTLPKNTGQRHCDLDSCALKQWKRLVQTKEMEDSDLGSSMLSPICDDLPEFDSQGPEFTPVEELNCDLYSPAYTNAICQALDRSRWPGVFYYCCKDYEAIQRTHLSISYCISLPWESTQSC